MKEAAVRAAGDEDQLHTEAGQNMRCSLPGTQTKEKRHFLVADLDHIGLAQSPEKLPPAFVQILPQGFAQVRIIGDELAPALCVGRGPVCSRAGRLVGQTQGAEVEGPCLLNDGQIQLLKGNAGISAGLPGEGKGPVAMFIKGDKGQGGEHIIGGDQTAGVNPGLSQGIRQEPAEGIIPHLAQKGGGSAEF